MNLKTVFTMLALILIASPVYAQATPEANRHWVASSAGFGMAIASGLCALGMGRAIAGATEGMARNPAASTAIRGALILGLVLIESLALYVIMIIFVKVQ